MFHLVAFHVFSNSAARDTMAGKYRAKSCVCETQENETARGTDYVLTVYLMS